MSWWTTIFIAVLTGTFGLVCAGLVASCCVKRYRVSSFEGGSGYFVIGMALLGGIAAAVAGGIVSRVVASWPDPGFFKGLACAWAVVIIVSALALLICRCRAHIPPQIAGRELMLEVELRLPAADTAVPAEREGTASFTLGSVTRHVQRKSQTGELHLPQARQEAGRWIIPASVFLFTRRGLRSIGMELGGKSVGGFIVPLPARPKARHGQWSDWGPRGRPGHPWPETESSYRFRIKQIEPEEAS